MNYKPENLVPGACYHIYNRGNNGGSIFFEHANYYYFLKLYQQYISPIADTLAWCLLKNHLHLLVSLKALEEIEVRKLRYSTVENPRTVNAARQFSHLFNAYTQAINKRYSRTGSLFENPFRRKSIEDTYLVEMIYYIHTKPLTQGCANTVSDYRWSSYNSIRYGKTALLNCEAVFSAFGGHREFIDFHAKQQNLTKITKFIIE